MRAALDRERPASRSRRSRSPRRTDAGAMVRARGYSSARRPVCACSARRPACRCSCIGGPVPLAHLGWFVRGGAVHEPANATGLTSLMTRASLKGTAAPQRAAHRRGRGVSRRRAVDRRRRRRISVDDLRPARARLDEAAELLGRRRAAARRSPDDALESERAVALANLAALRDDMYRWPLRLATQAAWGAHPYGRSVLGTEESLAAIDAGGAAALARGVRGRGAGRDRVRRRCRTRRRPHRSRRATSADSARRRRERTCRAGVARPRSQSSDGQARQSAERARDAVRRPRARRRRAVQRRR